MKIKVKKILRVIEYFGRQPHNIFMSDFSKVGNFKAK